MFRCTNNTKYQSNFQILAQNLDISTQNLENFTAEIHFFGCRIPQGVISDLEYDKLMA